nr:flagellar export protein FliJ [Desulfobacula sp.]
MKRFAFKLQPLLNYRDYLERVAKQNTAKAQMDVALCEKQIMELKNTRDQHQEKVEIELEQGTTASRFRQCHDYLDAVEIFMEQEKARKIKLSGILKQKLLELKKKTVEKKAMEIYRERLKSEYTQNMLAAEQKEMDEISSLKQQGNYPMKHLNRKIVCVGTCLILSLCFGTWIHNDGFLSVHGKYAFAEDKPPEQKKTPEKKEENAEKKGKAGPKEKADGKASSEETEPDPCPECPECPDPAKVVLRGLEEKKNVIDKQQKTMDQERKELDLFKEQIDEKIENLAALKKQIEEDLALLDRKKTQKEVEKEAEYEEKIGRLVKMYAGMKPKNAALIVDKMDLEVAQEIFMRMREASASEILSFVDSEKAAKISERLAFKRKQ